MKELEQQLLTAIQKGLTEGIEKSLAGYNSPLDKFIKSVIQKHEAKLSDQLDQALVACLEDSSQFAQQLKDAFTHKLARILVAKMDSETEKRVNDLRSNPATKAKMIIAIESILKESANDNS